MCIEMIEQGFYMNCYNAWLLKKTGEDLYTVIENLPPQELLDAMKKGNFSVAADVTVPGTCLCGLKEGGASKEEVLNVIEKYRELMPVANILRRM